MNAVSCIVSSLRCFQSCSFHQLVELRSIIQNARQRATNVSRCEINAIRNESLSSQTFRTQLQKMLRNSRSRIGQERADDWKRDSLARFEDNRIFKPAMHLGVSVLAVLYQGIFPTGSRGRGKIDITKEICEVHLSRSGLVSRNVRTQRLDKITCRQIENRVFPQWPRTE